MTKLDRVISILANGHVHSDPDAYARDIRDIFQPTEYGSIKDVADLIGRNRTTVHSWIQRGQHDIPPALGTTAVGQIWDMADWGPWMVDHAGLLGKDAIA